MRSIPKNVEETRTIPFVISDTSRDRHNTVLSSGGWDLEPYKRNNIVGYMHDVFGGNLLQTQDPDNVIGKGRVFFEGSQLIGDTTFEPEEINPLAEKIFRKALFGSLRSCSVSFNELERGYYGQGDQAIGGANETYYVGRRELLEYSIVNIPSNRNTQQRSMGDEPEGTLAYVRMKLGSGFSMTQIKSLLVSDVETLLEGREMDIRSTDPEKVRKMIEKYQAERRIDNKNDKKIYSQKERKMENQHEERELRGFSFIKFMREASEGQLTGFENEMHQEGTRELKNEAGEAARGFVIPKKILSRASAGQNITTAGDGGNLTNVLPVMYVDALKNALILPAMGATYLTGLTGTLPIVRGGLFTASWYGEGSADSDNKAAITKILMTAKRLSATGAFSKELLNQSSISVENWVLKGLVNANALAILTAVINGSAPAPTGILGISGIGDVAGGANGAVPTWANIVGLESAVANSNADLGSLGYLTNSKVRGLMKQTLKVSGVAGYIWDNDQMNGYKCGVTNAVPSTLVKGGSGAVCSAIIFGNFADLLIGEWGGLDVVVDPYSLKKQGDVEITVDTFVDVAVGHTASFAAMKDALAG